MRCYYEVLELPVGAQVSNDELKRKYKELALRYHPDKNRGNEDEATAKFMELNHAYSTLSDSRLRRWYDEHREEVLRASESAMPSERLRGRPVDVCHWFSYKFDPTDLFETFSKVFNDIYYAETESVETNTAATEEAPPFGDEGSSSYEVRQFYSYWESFSSVLSFAWVDVHDTTDAPNRAIRRCLNFTIIYNLTWIVFSRRKTRKAETKADRNIAPP